MNIIAALRPTGRARYSDESNGVIEAIAYLNADQTFTVNGGDEMDFDTFFRAHETVSVSAGWTSIPAPVAV